MLRSIAGQPITSPVSETKMFPALVVIVRASSKAPSVSVGITTIMSFDMPGFTVAGSSVSVLNFDEANFTEVIVKASRPVFFTATGILATEVRNTLPKLTRLLSTAG